jgi:hypothetical protein
MVHGTYISMPYKHCKNRVLTVYQQINIIGKGWYMFETFLTQ